MAKPLMYFTRLFFWFAPCFFRISLHFKCANAIKTYLFSRATNNLSILRTDIYKHSSNFKWEKQGKHQPEHFCEDCIMHQLKHQQIKSTKTRMQFLTSTISKKKDDHHLNKFLLSYFMFYGHFCRFRPLCFCHFRRFACEEKSGERINNKNNELIWMQR